MKGRPLVVWSGCCRNVVEQLGPSGPAISAQEVPLRPHWVIRVGSSWREMSVLGQIRTYRSSVDLRAGNDSKRQQVHQQQSSASEPVDTAEKHSG
jgi:hypothetical protein